MAFEVSVLRHHDAQAFREGVRRRLNAADTKTKLSGLHMIQIYRLRGFLRDLVLMLHQKREGDPDVRRRVGDVVKYLTDPEYDSIYGD